MSQRAPLNVDIELGAGDPETRAVYFEAQVMDRDLCIERLCEALEFYSDDDNAKDGGTVARDAINQWGDPEMLQRAE